MLVLHRGAGEKIFIGKDITIVILDYDERGVQIGIEAPRHIPIVRDDFKNHHETEDLPQQPGTDQEG